jgi:YjbE family integral membrane protein
VLAGDNAIVIALAARNLPAHLQKKAIVWGTVGAIVVRSVMTIGVVWLLKIPGLMLVGGLGLLWIAYKLLADDGGDEHGPVATTFWGAMRTIVIADALMGVDNVLGVAGAAHGAIDLVIIGLLVSVPIVVFGSKHRAAPGGALPRHHPARRRRAGLHRGQDDHRTGRRTQWVLVACAPRMTRNAGKWVPQSARDGWRQQWADAALATLAPALESRGDVVEVVVASGPLHRVTERLAGEHGPARILDARRPKFGHRMEPVSTTQGETARSPWQLPLALAGIGAMLVLIEE